ncbi:transposase [Gluconobacter oxydans]|uniref:Transposase n=1 Tax=Gluconobacter oxydans TaxID=442 RepID=A0AB35AR34_GLUOY|nr:transposase [Gluconobacter oxydans]GEC62009.1 transposase [Gluconobacter oxydans]
MNDKTGCIAVYDAAWSVWEPLIEKVRPKGKTPPKNLRRTISAIFWRHQNGAKWRALPSEFGPWWIAAQLFIRWSKLDVWQHLFEKVRGADLELDIVFLDGTTIRAHHKAAGAAKKGDTMNAAEIVRRLAAHVEALAPRSA